MRFIIDRIENGFAAAELEDGTHADLPLAALPEGCHEGSVVRTGPAPAGACRCRLKVVHISTHFFTVETETGSRERFPSAALPEGCRKDSVLTLWLDSAAEEERQREIRKLEDDVWAD